MTFCLLFVHPFNLFVTTDTFSKEDLHIELIKLFEQLVYFSADSLIFNPLMITNSYLLMLFQAAVLSVNEREWYRMLS